MKSFGIAGPDDHHGPMNRPADKAPPEGWTTNEYDDSEWGIPVKASCMHWPNAHAMGGIWHKKDKYSFYRIRMPTVKEMYGLVKVDQSKPLVNYEVKEEADLEKADQVTFFDFVSNMKLDGERVKCLREGCKFLKHTEQQHGYCCNRCRKDHSEHGGACERVKYDLPYSNYIVLGYADGEVQILDHGSKEVLFSTGPQGAPVRKAVFVVNTKQAYIASLLATQTTKVSD